ncbi:MAG: hypothetical protein OJF49_003075 [Ktedonobacterales bacterium]|jgi:hypothetical protein|nr:MAG: hypothetical protein OJF49_003075 [Ktedonobacterales bacterium]
MRNIAISDEIYQSITELATERGQTLEQLLADLLAQERWEDHAAHAYDAYHARGRGPGEALTEVLTEEEFFQSLQDQPRAATGEPDADV